MIPVLTPMLAKHSVKIGLAVAAVVLLVLAALWMSSAEKADDRNNQEVGASQAVIAGQQQTLEQLKDANDAEEDLRTGGERNLVRYNECLRNARTKSRCEQYDPAGLD